MGAVIAKGGRILSIASNVITTHPKQVEYSEYCISIHAELNAILLAQCSIKGSTIFVARINGNKNSKPCKHCYNYIKKSRIKKMVYWDNDKIVMEKVI